MTGIQNGSECRLLYNAQAQRQASPISSERRELPQIAWPPQRPLGSGQRDAQLRARRNTVTTIPASVRPTQSTAALRST